jgi:hypothetical protein
MQWPIRPPWSARRPRENDQLMGGFPRAAVTTANFPASTNQLLSTYVLPSVHVRRPGKDGENDPSARSPAGRHRVNDISFCRVAPVPKSSVFFTAARPDSRGPEHGHDHQKPRAGAARSRLTRGATRHDSTSIRARGVRGRCSGGAMAESQRQGD